MGSGAVSLSDSSKISPVTGSQAFSRRKTILICDDLRDILTVCSVFLRSKYNLLTAESGEECLSIYSKQVSDGRKIDVILLDYRLGDTTGEDVSKKIKQIQATKVILMTAFELDASTISNLREGKFIISQIKKPFSLKDLDRAIDLALSREE